MTMAASPAGEHNVVFPTSALIHAPGAARDPNGTPLPICPARSSRWAPSPTDEPVNCQRCLRRLALNEATSGQLTDERGQCGVCGDHPRLTLDGLLARHQQPTPRRAWCPGAGEPYVTPPRSEQN